jgi:hypothetical protein
MMTYIFTIDSVLPIGHKVLIHVIPTMERTQGLHLKSYLTDKRFLSGGYSPLLSFLM